jgi:hypothetical protein
MSFIFRGFLKAKDETNNIRGIVISGGILDIEPKIVFLAKRFIPTTR